MQVVILIAAYFIYIFLLLVALIAGGLMQLSKKQEQKIIGKILISVIAISYPVLLIVGATLSILAGLPFLILYELLNPDVHPAIAFFLLSVFTLLVAVSALYHWYLGSRMIINHFYEKPIDKGIENDRIYSIFIKKIINWNRNRKLQGKKAFNFLLLI